MSRLFRRLFHRLLGSQDLESGGSLDLLVSMQSTVERAKHPGVVTLTVSKGAADPCLCIQNLSQRSHCRAAVLSHSHVMFNPAGILCDPLVGKSW